MSAREGKMYRALQQRLKGRTRPRPGQGTSRGKPRLAYFSPLPPERSGISSYSLMLIPRLGEHYQIEVIVAQEQVSTPWHGDLFPVRDIAWFREHGHEFDRILYHIGNAPFHSHMFDLLEEWPGAVVLHDFFLGHVMAHIDGLRPGYLARCLYQGWGYPALRQLAEAKGKEQAIWDYPLNADVLAHATGMIVHSPFSRDLALRYYGGSCRQPWHVIPHLREPAPAADRTAARRQLDLPENAFVVCSFGHLTPTKMHDRLVDAWLASSLAGNDNCLLVFVGEKPSGLYGERLLRKIHGHPGGKRIRITGWAEAETFDLYLAAADMAVQLRTQSRGETSGAVIDCMNHGLATIVNAHGTMADIAQDSVCFLQDAFSDQELTDALEALWQNPEQRTLLAARARASIATDHNPEICAALYRDAIEAIYQANEETLGTLLDDGLDRQGIASPEDPGLIALAGELAAVATPAIRYRQLLVDVSAMVHTDLKTGIERVARAQLLELIRQPPPGFRVEPVYLQKTGLQETALQETESHWHYRYARRYGCQLLGTGFMALADEKVDVSAGDILYAPDFHPHAVINAHRDGVFGRLRAQGVSINILVHDLLPVTMPQHFPPAAPGVHGEWLRCICQFADRLICISGAVAGELVHWAQDNGVPGADLPELAVNHHGADIAASLPTRGLPRRATKVLKRLALAPTFIMVGTIEPRKGHLQTLAAFDLLWQRGVDANLVIVGKEGWKGLPEAERRTIPAIARQLDLHPRRNRQMFWLADISDEYLEALYAASQCLIAASEDEGFGLPLIEAALHQLPILARDIPVFWEVAGDCARYFHGDSPEDLAQALTDWLESHGRNDIPSTSGMAIRTWAENVAALTDILVPSPQQAASGQRSPPADFLFPDFLSPDALEKG